MIKISEEKYFKLHADNSGFIAVPRAFLHLFGTDAAVFMSQVVNLHFKAVREKVSKYDGWFFARQNYIEELTALSKRKQRKCKETLLMHKVIDCKFSGMPRKLYYKINLKTMTKLIQQFDEE